MSLSVSMLSGTLCFFFEILCMWNILYTLPSHLTIYVPREPGDGLPFYWAMSCLCMVGGRTQFDPTRVDVWLRYVGEGALTLPSYTYVARREPGGGLPYYWTMSCFCMVGGRTQFAPTELIISP